MKKLLITLLLCSFGAITFAQLIPDFGIKAGYSTMSLNVNQAKDVSMSGLEEKFENGFHFGVFLGIGLGKKWYIQPEVIYSSKKSMFDYQDEYKDPNDVAQKVVTGQVKQDLELHTLDIPIMLGYKLIRLPLVKLKVYGGPVLSYNLKNSLSAIVSDEFSKQVNDQLGTSLDTDTFDYEKELDIKNATWNAQVGAGVSVWKFGLDVSYMFGLSDLSNQIEKFKLEKERLFQVSLSFRFL